MASESGQTDVVSLLLDHGANIHAETEVGGTMHRKGVHIIIHYINIAVATIVISTFLHPCSFHEMVFYLCMFEQFRLIIGITLDYPESHVSYFTPRTLF